MKSNFSQVPLEVPDTWAKRISGWRIWVQMLVMADFLAQSLESQGSQLRPSLPIMRILYVITCLCYSTSDWRLTYNLNPFKQGATDLAWLVGCWEGQVGDILRRVLPSCCPWRLQEGTDARNPCFGELYEKPEICWAYGPEATLLSQLCSAFHPQ